MWGLKDMAASLQHCKASSQKGCLAHLVLILKTFWKLFPLAFLLQYETFFPPHLQQFVYFHIKGKRTSVCLCIIPRQINQTQLSHDQTAQCVPTIQLKAGCFPHNSLKKKSAHTSAVSLKRNFTEMSQSDIVFNGNQNTSGGSSKNFIPRFHFLRATDSLQCPQRTQFYFYKCIQLSIFLKNKSFT